jgi:hypothetical protein
MVSNIDPTKPTAGQAFTQDVRNNFATAAAEIGALQEAQSDDAPSDGNSYGRSNGAWVPVQGLNTDGGMSGPVQIDSADGLSSMTISVGAGVPGSTTAGNDMIGSLYANSGGAAGTALYISNGDGTWTPIT